MSGDDTIGGPVRMFPCRIEDCYPLMCDRASATCHCQLGSSPGNVVGPAKATASQPSVGGNARELPPESPLSAGCTSDRTCYWSGARIGMTMNLCKTRLAEQTFSFARQRPLLPMVCGASDPSTTSAAKAASQILPLSPFPQKSRSLFLVAASRSIPTRGP